MKSEAFVKWIETMTSMKTHCFMMLNWGFALFLCLYTFFECSNLVTHL